MKVEIKELESASDINLGDIFYKIGSNEASYMLHSSHDQIKLIDLEGRGTWNRYDSLEQAIQKLSAQVKNGILKHYPKAKYKLTLEEI